MIEREPMNCGGPNCWRTPTFSQHGDDCPTYQVEITCPKTPRYEGDLKGCGATFKASPDAEGFFDCPECGLFFKKEAI